MLDLKTCLFVDMKKICTPYKHQLSDITIPTIQTCQARQDAARHRF